MLDYFCIFARGGALLWTYQLTALKGGPVDALIRNCLLEERVGDKSYNYKPPQGASYTLKWTLHNVRPPNYSSGTEERTGVAVGVVGQMQVAC